MEIVEFREKVSEIGLPADIIKSLINDYRRDSKKGEALPLEEVLEEVQKTFPDGYIYPYPPFEASKK